MHEARTDTPFKLRAKFKPAGDQPKAIKELLAGLRKGLFLTND